MSCKYSCNDGEEEISILEEGKNKWKVYNIFIDLKELDRTSDLQKKH